MAKTSAPVALALDLPSEAATAALAARLARGVQAGDMIALRGDLGSGKTSFARAFVRALGSRSEEVPSPTFTLVEIYQFANRDWAVWHFDLYRLARPEDVFELGFEEAVHDGVVLVEWPERLGGLLPGDRLDLTLSPGAAPERRVARLQGSARWTARLAELAR